MNYQNPYHGVDWSRGMRGNLHCHSKRSDGADEPQAVIDAYRHAGYDFLMLSDHDCHATVSQLAGYDAAGMTLIPGCEISRDGPHMLQVGGTRAAVPRDDRQAVIAEIAADGGLAIMNHPNGLYPESGHCPQEQLDALKGYAGIEVFNALIGELAGSAYAFDRWDRLLSARRRVWGYANDDAHAVRHIGQGWMVVFADTRAPADIIRALGTGRFYGSSGVAIDAIAVQDGRARIRAAHAERIVAVGELGRRLQVADAQELEVALPETGYVRFECYGRGERQAWSQPISCGW